MIVLLVFEAKNAGGAWGVELHSLVLLIFEIKNA
jgi:hypothetical protein